MTITEEDTEKKFTDFDVYSSFLINFINIDFLSKLMNVSLYQSDFSSSIGSGDNDQEIIKFFNKFFMSLKKDIRDAPNLNIQVKPILNLVYLNEKVLNLRGDLATTLISYDNIFNHFTRLDTTTKKVVQDIVQNKRINDQEEFRKRLEEVLGIIELYNKFNVVALSNAKKFGALVTDAFQGATDATSWVNGYIETIQDGYSTLSELREMTKKEKFTDYMMFDDDNSVEPISAELIRFLGESFNRFKTGYPTIDRSGGGIESGSVTIISGPSNHAKSIFMINIIKNVIELNEWKENDAVLMITLEDDKFKLLSRTIGIFGNCNATGVKNGYDQVSRILNKNPELESVSKEFWDKQLKETITSVTKNKCRLIMMHSNENSFSMRDVSKFIDKLKMSGINIRLVGVDYLDVNKLHLNFFNCWKPLRAIRTTT